jgi:hypothetical protein
MNISPDVFGVSFNHFGILLLFSDVSEESLNALFSLAQVVASPAMLLGPKRRRDASAVTLRPGPQPHCY